MKKGMRQPQSPISAVVNADEGCDDDRDLLAAGLPGDVEALVAGGRHFGEIDRHAAELHAGGEALQQPADQDKEGGEEADRGVARHEGDQDRPHGHDQKRGDEPLPASDPVDIGAEDDGPQWPHQEAGAEGHEGGEQGDELAACRKEGVGDVGGVEAEQEKVEHFEKIAAGNAQYRGKFRRMGRHLLILPTRLLSPWFVGVVPAERQHQPSSGARHGDPQEP